MKRVAVTRNIHRRLITRLLLGWVVLSIVLGAVVYFIKIAEIDDRVTDLAISESLLIIKDKRYFSTHLSEADYNLLRQNLRQHIEDGNFIVLELYTSEHKKLFEVSSEDKSAVEAHDKYIEPKEKPVHFADKLTYVRFFIHGRIYLQFVVPLFDSNKKKYGYLEGIYRTDNEAMRDIKNILIGSLLLVVVTVLVTVAIFYPIIMSMNKDLIKLTVDLSISNIGMLEALGSAIAKRDSDTNSHNYRVTIYAVTLGAALGLKDDEMRSLIKGSFLHDIGKIAISDNVLLKPSKLTKDEFEHMKNHTIHGLDIVGRYAWLREAIDVVVYHHEKYDGSGYSGLKGEDIPFNARVFAIADVFDALTSKRPYKEPYSYEKAIGILKENSGKHFDAGLLDVFIDLSIELFEKMGNADDEILEKTLAELIRKYF
ncbi:MAG: HD domain-containing protein [Nitrospirota bacterium]